MDRAKYDHVVKNFFTCDPAALTEILQELLAALSAEETLPPVHAMSQNYETAQANPEIHILPGNLKDARDAIFPYFWGTDGWSSPLHLENVRGPANYASFVGAVACLLKNPNLCTDTYAQRSNELEVKSVTALANLLFYHTRDPWGIFTIGGTISNMYGARIGIEKVVPGAMRQGLREWGRVVGIVSEASHYCNQTIAGWTGMGTDNLLAIPTDPSLAMRLDRFAETLDRCYQRGDKVAFVIPTFGTTDAFGVDDVEGIRAILDETADRHGQPAPICMWMPRWVGFSPSSALTTSTTTPFIFLPICSPCSNGPSSTPEDFVTPTALHSISTRWVGDIIPPARSSSTKSPTSSISAARWPRRPISLGPTLGAIRRCSR